MLKYITRPLSLRRHPSLTVVILTGNTGDEFLKSWFSRWLAHPDSAGAIHIKIQGIADAQLGGFCDRFRDSECEAIAPFQGVGFSLEAPYLQCIYSRGLRLSNCLASPAAPSPWVLHKCSF